MQKLTLLKPIKKAIELVPRAYSKKIVEQSMFKLFPFKKTMKNHIKKIWKWFARHLIKLIAFNYGLVVVNMPAAQKLGNSQFGQDIFVFNIIFKKRKVGYFVDIGGNHPTHDNNSYLFELNGWEGIAFEPQERLRALWKGTRSTECLGYVIGSTNGQVMFREGSEGEHGFSGVEGFNKVSKESGHTFTVEQRRLDSVLKEKGVSHIDYLSVDVEGYEMHVLEGIDFSMVDIEVVGIENDRAWPIPFFGKELGGEFGSRAIRLFMRQRGYVHVARVMCDDFFVKKTSSVIHFNE